MDPKYHGHCFRFHLKVASSGLTEALLFRCGNASCCRLMFWAPVVTLTIFRSFPGSLLHCCPSFSTTPGDTELSQLFSQPKWKKFLPFSPVMSPQEGQRTFSISFLSHELMLINPNCHLGCQALSNSAFIWIITNCKLVSNFNIPSQLSIVKSKSIFNLAFCPSRF